VSVDAAAATAPPPESPGPLSVEHQQQLADAHRRAGKVIAASKVAAFNGWTAAVFAALTLPFALFGPSALLISAGLGVIAYNELRGRKLLRRFDLRGPRLLGFNQLGLLGMIIIYGVWRIWAGLTGPNPYEEHIAATPELESMLGPVAELHVTLTLLVYVSVIVFSIIFQGLTAWYYFSRLGHIRAYRAQTPAWIVQLQQLTPAA
jgi:hypothetical protein